MGHWSKHSKTAFSLALALMFSAQLIRAEGRNMDARASADASNAGFDELHINPGADFSKYYSVLIEDPSISFVPGWVRDHRNEVSRREVEDIKQQTAEALKMELTEKLSMNGGYQIVAEIADNTLRIRPAIIDMNLIAPGSHENAKLISSAGYATLSIEIYDARSNERLIKISDYRMSKGMGGRDFYVANRTTNALEFRKMMSVWAGRIRNQLDLMKEKKPVTGGPE